ncbi:MAG TPA: response regulator, partial [Elusimicrobia bacterium]|nr:response regulator [Elusimicrobiota bacterium]
MTTAKTGLKVLVIDDEKIIRVFFGRLLSAQGVEVTEAENGYRGVELVKEKSFDICFLDVKMPGMDGLETYRQIRKINPEIPVVMMTGYAVEETLEQAKKEGVRDSIYKPFDITQVNTILSDIQLSKFTTKPRILVVDDDENMLDFFSNFLG